MTEIDKPKYILFEKEVKLADGTEGVLFKSQKELAELIAERDPEEYGNIVSLLSFLSQALKANDEAGFKPIPIRLKRNILNIAAKRAEPEVSPFIERILKESFDFWKTDRKQEHHYTQLFLSEVQNMFSAGKNLIIIDSNTPRYGKLTKYGRNRDSVDAFNYLVQQIHTDKKKIRILHYYPNLATVSNFWEEQIDFMRENYMMDRNLAEMIVEKKNIDNLLTTYIVSPEYCQIPLYCFLENLDGKWSKEDILLSVSFDRNNQVRFIKYFDEDSQRIFREIVRPLITRQHYTNEVPFKAIKDFQESPVLK